MINLNDYRHIPSIEVHGDDVVVHVDPRRHIIRTVFMLSVWGGFLAFAILVEPGSGSRYTVLSRLIMLFLACCGIAYYIAKFFDRRPLMRLTPDAIFLPRYLTDGIPWDMVRDIEVYATSHFSLAFRSFVQINFKGVQRINLKFPHNLYVNNALFRDHFRLQTTYAWPLMREQLREFLAHWTATPLNHDSAGVRLDEPPPGGVPHANKANQAVVRFGKWIPYLIPLPMIVFSISIFILALNSGGRGNVPLTADALFAAVEETITSRATENPGAAAFWKWQGEVRFFIADDPFEDFDQQLARKFRELARNTGITFTRAKADGLGVDLHINFVEAGGASWDTRASLWDGYLADMDIVMNIAPVYTDRPAYLLRDHRQIEGPLHRAAIDLSMQALGFRGQNYVYSPTFEDNSETALDYLDLLIAICYDPRVKSGVPFAENAETIHTIAAEIAAAPSFRHWLVSPDRRERLTRTSSPDRR